MEHRASKTGAEPRLVSVFLIEHLREHISLWCTPCAHLGMTELGVELKRRSISLENHEWLCTMTLLHVPPTLLVLHPRIPTTSSSSRACDLQSRNSHSVLALALLRDQAHDRAAVGSRQRRPALMRCCGVFHPQQHSADLYWSAPIAHLTTRWCVKVASYVGTYALTVGAAHDIGGAQDGKVADYRTISKRQKEFALLEKYHPFV